jgi:hypothetical protein
VSRRRRLSTAAVDRVEVVTAMRAEYPTVREAVTLPLLFLSVALFGGFRMTPAGAITLAAPSLMALILALILLAVLHGAGAMATERLVSPLRRPLENASGSVVLATLFGGSAQVFTALTPDAGLLNVTFNLFFLALLWNTLAARPDAVRLLRGLLVIFGIAFIVKHIALAALYDPQGGLTKRVLTALLEGVTLGTMDYTPVAPVTGYVAFFTILAFMLGLVMLPKRSVGP